MNTTVAIAILAFWAVLATCFMIAALRSRSYYIKTLADVRKDRDAAIDVAEGFKREVNRLQPLAFPEPKPAYDSLSLARAVRKITGPVKPTSARTMPASRTSDRTDSLIAGVALSEASQPSTWSGNFTAPDPTPSPSCDTSPSFSSDGGSCGGGE
jgi:hypothetical protein